LQDLFIIPTGGKLCNERMVTLRKRKKKKKEAMRTKAKNFSLKSKELRLSLIDV
jgi:hypothetical protein